MSEQCKLNSQIQSEIPIFLISYKKLPEIKNLMYSVMYRREAGE